MNQLAAISLWCGGPGSGCVGPNCGRPKVLDDLQKQHDTLKEDKRRQFLDTPFQSRKQHVLKWQREKLQNLMDHLTDASSHPMVLDSVRKAARHLSLADDEMANGRLDHAGLEQEGALMFLHEGIEMLEKYPSSIKQVVHAQWTRAWEIHSNESQVSLA